MDKEDLEEELKQEIETEAAMLERRVNAKEELTSLTMPDDSYEQLMKHIQEKEQRKLKALVSEKRNNNSDCGYVACNAGGIGCEWSSAVYFGCGESGG